MSGDTATSTWNCFQGRNEDRNVAQSGLHWTVSVGLNLSFYTAENHSTRIKQSYSKLTTFIAKLSRLVEQFPSWLQGKRRFWFRW